MYFLEVAGSRPVADDTGFGWVHGHSVGRDNEAQVFRGVGMELALLRFDMEVVLSESVENKLDVFFVFSRI